MLGPTGDKAVNKQVSTSMQLTFSQKQREPKEVNQLSVMHQMLNITEKKKARQGEQGVQEDCPSSRCQKISKSSRDNENESGEIKRPVDQKRYRSWQVRKQKWKLLTRDI